MKYPPRLNKAPEIIETEQDENGVYVPVTAAVHPLRVSRELTKAKVGTSVSALVRDLCPPEFIDRLCVTINGNLIDPNKWELTCLLPNDVVVLRAMPQGGNTMKSIESAVLMLAVVVISIAFVQPELAGLVGSTLLGSASLATAAVYAGVGVVSALGMLAVNALVPPSLINTQSYKFSLAGNTNQSLPYGVVPRCLGRTIFFPPNGATPFTTYAGSSQWLFCLFDLGPGPINISDIKLGQTPIGDFSDLEYYTYEGRNTDGPLQLYTSAISVPLPQPYIYYTDTGSTGTLETGLNVTEIEIDISYPGGLFNANGEGNLSNRTVGFNIFITNVVSGAVIHDTQNVTGGTTSLVGVTYARHNLPAGQYTVQLTQSSGAPAPGKGSATGIWTGFRYISASSGPILPQNHAKIELKVRASQEINGTIQTLNCVAQSYVQVWNGSSFTEELNTHPAWAAYTVMTDPFNPRPLTSSQIDLTALLNWATAYPEAEFNYIFGSRTTIWQALKTIGAAGRAVPVIRDGLYSFVCDILQTSPVQIFSTRTIKDFKAARIFVDQIEGMAIQYVAETMGWQQYTTYSYAAGYDSSTVNGSAMSSMFLVGVTSDPWAYKLGTYYFACSVERTNKYTFDTSLDHLACNVGDRVWVQHDVVSAGIISGRIQSITRSSGNVTNIVLDEVTTGDGVSSYSVIVRTQQGGVYTKAVTVVTSQTASFPLVTAYNDSTDPWNVGDLVILATTTVGVLDAIVKQITPRPDFMATVTCLDYVPSLFDGDGVTPPPVVNNYQQSFISPLPTASVTITSLTMDESSSLATSTGPLIPQIQGQFIVNQNGQLPSMFDVQWQSTTGLVLSTGTYTESGNFVAGDTVTIGTSPASGVYTETGNFAAGDTISLGGVVYTFVTAIGTTPGNVLIGGTVATSLGYLANAINDNGVGIGTQYIAQLAGANPYVSAVAAATTLTVAALPTLDGAAASAVGTVYTPASTSHGSFAHATLVFGSLTYNFVTSIGSTPGNVLIGATVALSLGYLTAAINNSGVGVGTQYIAQTVGAHPDVTASATTTTLVLTSSPSLTAAEANAITTTTGGTAEGSFASATLTNGVDVIGWTAIPNLPASANTFYIPISAAAIGQTYNIRIRGNNMTDNNPSAWTTASLTISNFALVPLAPTSLTVTPIVGGMTAAVVGGGYTSTIQYNLYANTVDVFSTATLIASSQTSPITVTGLSATTLYYFWVTTVNGAGVESLPSAAVAAIPLPVGYDALGTEFTDFVANTGQIITDLQNTVNNLIVQMASATMGSYQDYQTLNTAIFANTGGLSASFTSQVFVATGLDGSIVTSIASLQSALSGYTGASAVSNAVNSLQTQITTNAGNISTSSTAITALNSQVGNFYSSGLFRVATSATESGADATITIGVAATSGGSTYTAAMYLSAMTGGSTQVAILAGQFYVTDGSNFHAPFYFSGGTAYIDNAVITNLTGVHIQAASLNVGTLAVSGSITTPTVAANAITGPVVGTGTSSTLSSSAFGTVASVTITTYGGPVLVDYADWFTRSGGHSPLVNYQVLNGSTTMAFLSSGGSGAQTCSAVAGTFEDTSVSGSPGTYTYYLQEWANGDPSCVSEAPVIRVVELKK